MDMPWMKFFPSDWRADAALRMCSFAARGAWMEMLCLMHESDQRGYLLVKGKQISNAKLASLCGSSLEEIEECLRELEDAGVFSRTDDETIYSRRMLRDVEQAERHHRNGKRGGNPSMMPGVNPPVNPRVKGGIRPRSQKPEARSQTPEARSQTPEDHPRPGGCGLPIAPQSAATASLEHVEITGSPPPDPPLNALDEDPKDVLFRDALKWLCAETGKSPASVRSALGKLLKVAGGDHHAGLVLGVLRDAKREGKADPIAWAMAMVAKQPAVVEAQRRHYVP